MGRKAHKMLQDAMSAFEAEDEAAATAEDMVAYLSGNKGFSIVLYGDDAYTDEELKKYGLTQSTYEQVLQEISNKMSGISDMDWKEIVDKYDIIVDETDLNKLRQKGIPEDEQRRNLMVKEYFFCKKYKKQIEAKAKKIYEKQMVTGVVAPYHCNYKVLESVADTYK